MGKKENKTESCIQIDSYDDAIMFFCEMVRM